MKAERKSLFRVGSSRRDLKEFPDEVQDVVGYVLDIAQQGKKHRDAKPLSEYGGASILEIAEDHDGDTYRAVYTVSFEGVIYVLHAFQKKSKKGIATPKPDLDLIKARLKQAEEHDAEWSQKKKGSHG